MAPRAGRLFPVFFEALLEGQSPLIFVAWWQGFRDGRRRIKAEPEYPINMYKFFDDNEDEIRLG